MSTASHNHHYITVTGEATQDLCPDEAAVNFGVDTFSVTLAEATALNEKSSATLVASLGIKDCHISMATLSVEVQYDHRNHENPIASVVGYVARRAYAITLEKNNLDLLEKLIAVGLTNGANRLSNFETKVVNLAKSKEEVQKQAVRNAKAKAVLMATELGLKVGHASRIVEKEPHSARAQSMGAYGGAPAGGSMPLGNVSVGAVVEIDFQLVA